MTQFTNMTLNDLKTGMIVTLRNGYQYTVMRDMAVPIRNCNSTLVRVKNNDREWMDFDGYNSNLTRRNGAASWDIVKVETASHPFGFMDLKYEPELRTVIWREIETVKLTVAEIEARLGYKVEIVSEEE